MLVYGLIAKSALIFSKYGNRSAGEDCDRSKEHIPHLAFASEHTSVQGSIFIDFQKGRETVRTF